MSEAGLVGVADAVAKVKRLDSVDVAFAARVDRGAGTFVLGEFLGARTNHLSGVVSAFGHGLGGKCITLGRPVHVADYAAARGITHEYDHAVTSEGLCALFAVPIHIDGQVHGLVYGASRRVMSFGDRLINAAGVAVRTTARISLPRVQRTGIERPQANELSEPCSVEMIREIYGELRAIAGGVGDPVLRDRLQRLSEKLCRPPADDAARIPVRLSPRELDVLAEIAVGRGNAEIAQLLGLTVDTVKSYVKSAMSKLMSRNRVEAVHRARRSGLLP
jgi:DNA-binding CsgD family transcriptional regulator/putative methionine-R-sulfoxide reductase with GAF domain